MYAEFVLYVAHVHTALTLVVDKHRQSAAVVCALFGTCQHKVYVAVTVCYKALHSVEKPATVFLRVCGFEHHTLQIRTGIRLGEVHAHGLARTYTGYVFFSLLFAAELIERVYA